MALLRPTECDGRSPGVSNADDGLGAIPLMPTLLPWPPDPALTLITGPLFSGKYYVCEVKHLFDGEGLRTEFVAERPGLGKP